MSAAEHLVGRVLTGARHGTEWTVREQVGFGEGATPGNFSVAYVVEDAEHNQAFLKASDLGMFTRRGEDLITGLQRAVNAHAFERQILDHCRGNNLDRVVTALDYGQEEITHFGTRDIVFFLVFEKADGDLRKHIQKEYAADLLWCATALHNFFVAISQLHGVDVAHNDIKPANALVFDLETHKIGDLGRATSPGMPAYHDRFQCAGDPRFAPPEQLYPSDLNCAAIPIEKRREAGDLYNLGSIAYYMLVARMVTPEVVATLRPEFRPKNISGGSGESYQAALPYWRDTFDHLIAQLHEAAIGEFGPGVKDELRLFVDIVLQLCEPDPLLRGHPDNRAGMQNRYGLERYISRLANAKARLAIKAA